MEKIAMRYLGILPLIWACGGEQVIDKQENSAPVIMIGSHSDGAEVLEGYSETFRATVSDDDDEDLDLQVAWYVGENIVCDWAEVSPAGEAYCDIVFSPTDSSVIAEVRDPQGAGGRAELSIVVQPTEAPVIELLAPTQGQGHYSNELIQFSALVSDNEDAPEDLIISWTSNQDGELLLDTSPDSDGVISDFTYLSEGQHAIELRVEDSSGKVSKEQFVLQVSGENATPDCAILEPIDRSAVVVGDSILFVGQVSDENIPATELMTIWRSDKDGDLGSGTINSAGQVSLAYEGLSANDHVISLVVEDEVGAQCQDTIVLYIGNPPTAEIVSPADGDVYSLGDSVIFQGLVTDTEDQPNEIAVTWTSSIDGELQTGNANSQGTSQFSVSDLSAGLHSISFTAVDTTGLVADDLITFRVNTPPTAPSVILSPDPILSTQTLNAAASGSTDADGHSVTYSYQWYENGVLSTNVGTSVPSSDLDVGEVWTVRVTPYDGYVDGQFTEASITISNSDPVVSNVLISSSDGSYSYNDSTLTCTATATDADETVSATYSWNINGTVYNGASVDLSNYSLSPSDSVTCTASVTDSNGGSASSSSSENIDNRDPIISSVSISPSPATTDALLTCSASASDADGETLITSYEWMLNGSSLGSGNSLQLDNSLVSPSDAV